MKISINNDARCIDLVSDFNKYLKESYFDENICSNYWGNVLGMLFPSEDDDELLSLTYGYSGYDGIYDDEYDIEEYYNRGYKGHHSRSNKKRNMLELDDDGCCSNSRSCDDILRDVVDNGKDVSDDDLNILLKSKKDIYYYSDIFNQKSCRKFKNLESFYKFLDEEGIEISDNVSSIIMRSRVSHCCCNERLRSTEGRLELCVEDSYSLLCWECEATSSM